MADSNRTKLAFSVESAYNTNPGAGAYTELRVLSESLKEDLSLASSSEIRSYRDIPELNQTDRAVSGSINSNLYYDANATEKLLQFGLASAAFSTADVSVVASGTVTTSSARTFTVNTPSTWVNNPAVGSWVYISGFSNAASNGYHQVATANATTFTTNSAIGAAEGTVSAVTIVQLSQLTNGTTAQNIHINRTYTDLTTQGENFGGMNITGLSVDASGQDMVTFSTDWIGAQATSDTASVEAIENAAATTAAMSATNGVQWVREGTGSGSVNDLACLGFSFTVDNGIRKQYELGTFGPSGLKLGDFTVTGTLQAYFSTATLFDKFLNQTATGLSIAIGDEATTKGNTYIFDFPSVRFTDGNRAAGGRNQDIIADMSWQAIYDGSSHTMKVAKTASA